MPCTRVVRTTKQDRGEVGSWMVEVWKSGVGSAQRQERQIDLLNVGNRRRAEATSSRRTDLGAMPSARRALPLRWSTPRCTRCKTGKTKT